MQVAQTLYYYWDTLADPRTKNWLLMKCPFILPTVIWAYLYFVLRCGPRYMATRKAYELKTFIRFYNIAQAVSNAIVVFAEVKYGGLLTKVSIFCEPFDYSQEPHSVALAKIGWWILILKYADLIETGVFVLRKKQRQISFLHLYHHVSTLIIQFLSVRYIVSGMSSYITLVNCFVHVIMYTYYFLSTCGPTVQRAIASFKPMITIMQMVQFCILVIYSLQGFTKACHMIDYRIPLGIIVDLLINLGLFYHFYKTTYKKLKTK